MPLCDTKLICVRKSSIRSSVLIWGGGIFPFDIFPNVDQDTNADKPFSCNKCNMFKYQQEWPQFRAYEKEMQKTYDHWTALVEKNNKTYGTSHGTAKV